MKLQFNYKYLLGLIVTIFANHYLAGQELNRNNVWMIGSYGSNNMGIDFNGGAANTFLLNRPMGFFYSNAGICDTNGQLLFYTNGDYIANRFHSRLYNSTNFNPTITDDTVGGSNMSQSLIVLPLGGVSNQYIIVHENGEHFNGQYQPLQLRYSIIDMSLDSGRGGVLPNKKNIVLISDTLLQGKITACKHGNGRDWWIIAHRWNSDLYYKILVTPFAITFSSQHIGSIITYNFAGQNCFSPDGTKLVSLHEYPTMDIMDFDRCTGLLSNCSTINLPDPTCSAVGCAFSQSGKYLYACNNIRVFQFDMWASNIAASIDTVAVSDSTLLPGSTFFYLMQLAPDNKIYITTIGGTNVLHVINYPDSAGLSCNLVQHGITLPSYNAFSLPNVPIYGLGRWTGSSCDTLPLAIMSIDSRNEDLNLFPNPIHNNEFTVTYPSAQREDGQLVIFDAKGKVIYSAVLEKGSSELHINSDEYLPGIYIVQINVNGKCNTLKVIKE